jgi:hypothetical protein
MLIHALFTKSVYELTVYGQHFSGQVIMKQYWGLPLTFSFHAVLCFVYLLFVRARMPETKGKSLEEIEQAFTRR